MKFYDCTTAPSPKRVRDFIKQKGIEIDTVNIDLANGKQFDADFMKIIPDCVVPALELDDGTVLTEVVAICDYLESQYPEPPLMGSTPTERAQTLMWNAKIEQQGLLAVAEAFRNTAKGFKDRALTGPVNYAQIPELAERGRARLAQFYDRLDAQLEHNEFVAGSHYSIADITAKVTVDFATMVKVPPPESATHLHRWYQAVS